MLYIQLEVGQPTACEGKVNAQALDTAISNINMLRDAHIHTSAHTHMRTYPEGHVALCEAFSGKYKC